MALWIKEPSDLSHIPRTQVKGQRAGEQYTSAIPALLWGGSEDKIGDGDRENHPESLRAANLEGTMPQIDTPCSTKCKARIDFDRDAHAHAHTHTNTQLVQRKRKTGHVISGFEVLRQNPKFEVSLE